MLWYLERVVHISTIGDANHFHLFVHLIKYICSLNKLVYSRFFDMKFVVHFWIWVGLLLASLWHQTLMAYASISIITQLYIVYEEV